MAPFSAERLTFDMTAGELARAVLLRAFKMASPPLGTHVLCRYRRAYGEDSWLKAAQDCLSRRMLTKVKDHPTVLQQDIFILSELLVEKLDRVFLPSFRGVAGATERSLLLQSMVADVDCVSRTRTWMFHGVDVSVREVYRCLVSLQRLVTRLSLRTSEDFHNALQTELHVSDKTERGFGRDIAGRLINRKKSADWMIRETESRY